MNGPYAHDPYGYDGYTVPHRPAIGLALAEPGKRLAARLIDGLILTPIAFALACPLLAVIIRDMPAPDHAYPPGRGPEISPTALVYYLLIIVVTAAVNITYETVCVANWDATIGKRAMKLVVLRAEDGGRLGWGQACGRVAGYHLLSLINILAVLDALWLLWDQPNRQTLHDKMARTIVVRIDYAPYGPRAVLGVR